jgi:phospholipid transport system substrate-binding protein
MAPDQQAAPRCRVCRRAVLALALVSLPRPLRAAADPQAFVADLGGRAFAILEQPTDSPRFQALAALLEEVVDLDLVARLVLGRHWNEASPAQRTAYLGLFRTYARDSLARRLSGYAGGGSTRVAVAGSRAVGDGDTLVDTRITLEGSRAPLQVAWRVRPEGQRLVIIDVVAEGGQPAGHQPVPVRRDREPARPGRPGRRDARLARGRGSLLTGPGR